MDSMNADVTYFTLSNGMRGVHLSHAAGSVDYFGVCVNIGSRDETVAEHGLAHFVEHTIFKGTRRRRSWHILNRMERVGGELNAFTTKEETVVYTIAPCGHLDRAAELIADLIANSTFPADEIDRERDVIEDEISSYLDTPSEAVYDEFDELFFAGSPLAHNILGDARSLRQLDSSACRSWLDRYFTPGEMVIFYAGSASTKRVCAMLEKHFGVMDHGDVDRNRHIPAEQPRFEIVRDNSLHQTHTVWGVRIPGFHSPDSHVYSLLSNIIGGPGMNSLLNVEMRERRGLVYTVEASTAVYNDCGVLTVYYGCDDESNPRCREVMHRVLGKIAAEGISPRKLEEAKRQYMGQLTVAAENREQRALSAGRRMLVYGRVASFEERMSRIASITPAQFNDAAARLKPDFFSILTLK